MDDKLNAKVFTVPSEPLEIRAKGNQEVVSEQVPTLAVAATLQLGNTPSVVAEVRFETTSINLVRSFRAEIEGQKATLHSPSPNPSIVPIVGSRMATKKLAVAG